MVILANVYSVNENIYLKKLSSSDVEEFYHLVKANRVKLKTWIQWVDLCSTVAGTQKFIQELLDTQKDSAKLARQISQYGIWEDNVLVGGFLIINNSVNHSFEFGFWKGANAQEQGLMTKVCAKLMTDLFKTGANRIEIHLATGNTDSINLAKRLHFTREGTLRQVEFLYDHYVDHEIYSMLKSEWPQKQKLYKEKYA
jgi:ribosomal-protein-serine acetyltransferase